MKAGAERRDTEFEKGRSVAAASNATSPLTPNAPGPNDIYNIKEARSVAFLQDEWRITKTHSLTPGIRYELNERDATDRNGVKRTSSSASPNPSAHYRWAVTENTIFRASVAQTLKFPKFDDVNPLVTLATGVGAGAAINPDKRGNADLKPEQAIGLETGIEQFFWDNSGHFGFNLYNREIKNFTQTITRQEGSRFVASPSNAGDARFWSTELDWRVPLLRKGPHDLALTGSHSEFRSEVSNSTTGVKSDVKDMPPRVTNLGLNWRHGPSKWSAGFSFNYIPAFASDVNPDGVREVKHRNASMLLDLFAVKVFGPMAELRLTAKNMLAVKKEEATTKFNANGSFNTAEAKVESSRPTIFLTFVSHF